MSDNLSSNVVRKTTDYSKFKFIADNREIERNHVIRLMNSISQDNFLHMDPIIVTSDLEVIDGQHRLKAAEELGVPIYYQIDDNYDPQKMILMNTTQKGWTTENYLNFWVHHGNDSYRRLKEFADNLDFKVGNVLRWFQFKGGGEYRNFKTGSFRFKISAEMHSAMLSTKRLIDYCKDKDFKPKQMFTQQAFHKAAKEFFMSPLVDHEHFFERLETAYFLLSYQAVWHRYYDIFVDIYNYDMKKNRIKIVQDGEKRTIQA